MATWNPDSDDAGFERMMSARHGNGSPRALNKGRAKRRFKAERLKWKKNGSKHRG